MHALGKYNVTVIASRKNDVVFKSAPFLIIFFLLLPESSYAQSFQVVTTSVTPMSNARSIWADLNNDDLPDLIVSGIDQAGTNSMWWYQNNGDSTFNIQEISRLSQVAFDLSDYDHDGYIDLLVSGKTASDEKVLRVFRNNKGMSFSDQEFNLEGVTQGDVLWTDFDYDTKLGILATGLDAVGNERILVYQNVGLDYQEVEHSMLPLAFGQLTTLDANKDGLGELVLSGFDALGNPTVSIYTVNEQLETSIYFEGIDGYAQNVIGQADINEDGYEDLVFSGITDDLEKATYLYLNNQTNGFTRSVSALDSMSNAALALGDLNNDGRSDLVLMGLDNEPNPQSLYYLNTGLTGISRWTESSDDFEPLYSGSFSLADFNLDGSLDLFQTGNSSGPFRANLYASDIHLTRSNLPPTEPTGLISSTNYNQVILSWTESSDDFTATPSLTYNVYLSRAAGGADLVLSPMSSISTGLRRIYRTGNVGYANQMTVRQLPEGRYYWSVQAIDNAYQGSAFADEAEFVICEPFSLGADTTVCFEEVIRLTAGEVGDEVNWYSLAKDLMLAESVLTYDHLVLEKDTLVAELTKDDLGCVLYDTIIIDVVEQLELDLGPQVTICQGDTAFFELQGFDAVNWYSLNAGLQQEDQDFLEMPVSERDTIVAEGIYGSCTQTDTVIVDVYLPPTFQLPGDTSLCGGAILSLSLEGFEMVNWFVEDQWVTAGMEYDHEIISSQSIIVEGIDANGCSGFDTLLIEALALPQIDLGKDTAICIGSSISFEVEGFEEITWYSISAGELTAGSQFSHTPEMSDTIIVEVTNASGCKGFDTLVIEVNPLPVVDLGKDFVVCEGENVLLQAPDETFERIDWYSISGEPLAFDQWFFIFEATHSDTLLAQVTDVNTCINSDTVIVKVNPVPDFYLPDTTLCFGDELTLAVSDTWQQVNWIGEGNILLEAGQDSYTFGAVQSTEIVVEVIHEGCTGYDTAMVTVNPLPEIGLLDSTIHCAGETIQLEVGDIGVNYAWTSYGSELLSLERSLNLLAGSNQKVFLQVENEAGCKNRDSVEIIVHDLPQVDIMGDLEVCDTEIAELSISNDFSNLVWYFESRDTLGNDNPLVQFEAGYSGTIHVWLKDQYGCVGEDSVELLVHPAPHADAGPDQFICFGEETKLGGSVPSDENLTYEWSDVEYLSKKDISDPIAFPTASEWFTLSVTNIHDCTAKDSVFVEVNPQIIADAGPDQILCEGETVIIGPDEVLEGVFHYTWSPVSGLSSPTILNPIVSIDTDQSYFLSVFSGDCEVEHDTVFVTVKPGPAIDVSPTQSIGPGQSIRLEAYGGVAYRWQPEDLLDNPTLSDPVSTPLSNTLFTVEVENEFGCLGTDSVMVFIQNVLFIPNLFTPNGDGSNDEFKVYGSGIAELLLFIYDMNGRLVHTFSSPEEALTVGWDGTRDGRLVASGTYLWTLDGQFADGSRLQFEGSDRGMIQLLR